MAKIVQRFQCSRQGSGHVSQCCSYSYIYICIYMHIYIYVYRGIYRIFFHLYQKVRV